MKEPGSKQRARIKEEGEQAKEKTPEEGEIAGYILYIGKDFKILYPKTGHRPGYHLPFTGPEQLFHLFLRHPGLHQNPGLERTLAERYRQLPRKKKISSPRSKEAFVEEKIPQVVSREIRQFGYDFFLSKATTFAPIADVPVGPDYVIGPGDAFTITLWGRLEASFAVEVDPNGEISLPKVGVLKVWGLTFSQLQSLLFDQISKYYKDFQMNVTMEKLRTIRVFVVGEAQSPGNYLLSSLSTVYHALIAAGGPSKRGSLRNIQLIRNGKVCGDDRPLRFLFERGPQPGSLACSRGIRFSSRSSALRPASPEA